MRRSTIFVQFECISRSYDVAGPTSPALVHFVLDSEPLLAASAAQALDAVYPDYPWSSPGDSQIRRIFGWVFDPHLFPELHESPQAGVVLPIVQEIRGKMRRAYDVKAYERHYFAEVPAAIKTWDLNGYQVVTYSTGHSVERQRAIVELAVPDVQVHCVEANSTDAAEVVPTLLSRFQLRSQPPVAVLSADASSWVAAWSRQGIRCVLIDRVWVSIPYYQPGYGYYTNELTQFDVLRESTRDSS